MTTMLTPKQRTQLIVATGIGSMLEFYDFILYALFASEIGNAFFPCSNPWNCLLMSLAAFAVGFVSRPIGAIVLGVLGDRIGRKRTLRLSISLMGLASLMIVVTPTYAQIGIAAPCLLILARLAQGFAVGGELASSVTFLAEHADPKQRGLLIGWLFFFVNSGHLLASGTSIGLGALLPGDALADWGWRIAFLIAGSSSALGYYLRSHLHESPLFKKAIVHNRPRNPFKILFSEQRGSVIRGFFINASSAVFVGVVLMYMPTYLHLVLHFPLHDTLLAMAVAQGTVSLLAPAYGWLSDRLGRKRVLSGAMVVLAVAAYPLFVWLGAGDLASASMALAVLAIIGTMLVASCPTVLAEIFPTESRCTCVAFSYNLPYALLAGTTPVVSVFLMQSMQSTLAPCLYLIIFSLTGLVALRRTEERTGSKL